MDGRRNLSVMFNAHQSLHALHPPRGQGVRHLLSSEVRGVQMAGAVTHLELKTLILSCAVFRLF